MSQQPHRDSRISRIIRIPQTPTSGPSVTRLGPGSVPSSPEGCPRCGCLVADRVVHGRFHEELAKTSRWIQLVNRFLSLLTRNHPELGTFPTTDDTPTTGESTTTDGE